MCATKCVAATGGLGGMSTLRTLAMSLVLLLAPAAMTGASARHQAAFVLSCENARSYPILPRAVSDAGDLVTGYIVTAHHHRVHIRLMPIGVGYRYAARGLWLDGRRGDAELDFGKHHALACSVVRS